MKNGMADTRDQLGFGSSRSDIRIESNYHLAFIATKAGTEHPLSHLNTASDRRNKDILGSQFDNLTSLVHLPG